MTRYSAEIGVEAMYRPIGERSAAANRHYLLVYLCVISYAYRLSKKPLSNRKLEIVAQQLAKGAMAAETSIAASYRTNGAAFAANCRQRANYPEVKSRIAALQAKTAETLTVDLAWIYERLVEMASRAAYNEGIRTSDKLLALDMLIRLCGYYAPEKKVVVPAESKSAPD